MVDINEMKIKNISIETIKNYLEEQEKKDKTKQMRKEFEEHFPKYNVDHHFHKERSFSTVYIPFDGDFVGLVVNTDSVHSDCFDETKEKIKEKIDNKIKEVVIKQSKATTKLFYICDKCNKPKIFSKFEEINNEFFCEECKEKIIIE